MSIAAFDQRCFEEAEDLLAHQRCARASTSTCSTVIDPGHQGFVDEREGLEVPCQAAAAGTHPGP